jgi:hypothetical protein
MYDGATQIEYNDSVIKSFKTVEIVKIHVRINLKTGKRNQFNRFLQRRELSID